jgi:RimJ/RimL family protein N-acetyltransferase
VAKYEAVERLRDGRRFRVRALQSDDRAGLLSAVSQSSAQYVSPLLLAQAGPRSPTLCIMHVDFIGRVDLVAELEEDGRGVIIGGARYVLIEPSKAEVAFVVFDRYHEQGLLTASCAISRQLPITPDLRS